MTRILGLLSVNGGQVLGAALDGLADTLTFSLEPVNSPSGVFGFDPQSFSTSGPVGSTVQLTVVRIGGSKGWVAYLKIGMYFSRWRLTFMISSNLLVFFVGVNSWAAQLSAE